jgi:hypothetical protein
MDCLAPKGRISGLFMDYPSSQYATIYYCSLNLGFADSEHLGTAFGASTLSGRFAILHFNCLGAAHFPFSAALHAVCLHRSPPIF